MLAQRFRFHGHGSLRYVYKNGDSIRSRLVTIKYITNKKRKNSRVTVVVSKKVLKSAVGRNRIRRRLYEIVRRHMDEFEAVYDIALLVFSSEVATMEAAELEQTVISQLKEAQIIK